VTKAKKEEEETQESQKLTPRDKKEIGEGACVNCAVAFLVLLAVTVVAMVL